MTTETYRAQHLAGGERREAKFYKEIRDPGKLDEVVGEVAEGTPADVDAAVRAAHGAFPGWRDTPVEERAALMLKTADIIGGSMSDLVPLLIREHGGVLGEAQLDFGASMGVIQAAVGDLEKFYAPNIIEDEDCRISIERAPAGVVAAILPWNMPVILSMMRVVPTLLTGNTLVYKPSSTAAIACTTLMERIAAIYPPGVINIINGSGPLGDEMTAHPLVRKVAFTGGTDTGRQVMLQAAVTIKGVDLELGGNDAAIILEDADIELAVERLSKGIFTRTGQICFAVKRIYAARPIYDAFVDALVAKASELVVGHGLTEGVTMGPLHNEAQYTKVTGHIRDAAQEGTLIEVGSKADPDQWTNGYYVLPTIVRDTSHTAPLTACEQFGPVIPVVAFDDVDQAIEWTNDSEWGLCSSIWTKDLERGVALARRVEAGTTFINEHSLYGLDFRMPFGGVKQSGIGRNYGVWAMEDLTELHAIKMMKH